MAALSIALAIYRLHPRGGLEDNCIRIAEELHARGHRVTVFATDAAPRLPVEMISLPNARAEGSNHRKMQMFAKEAAKAIAQGAFDRTAAFQTMPGFDFLFLADKIRNDPNAPLWKRIGGRFRAFAALERAVFAPESPTIVIGLSDQQRRPFIGHYGSNAARIRIAPPTIARAKHQPESRSAERRASTRRTLGISATASVWLSLVLAPKTKGLDRTVQALALCDGAHLLIGGLQASDRNARSIVALAKQLKVEDRIHWLGYQSGQSLISAMAASDVLAHPARKDVTGAVILEAIINGLPVVATGLCGFAPHIGKAQAGRVIDEPFSLQRYAASLLEVSSNGAAYSANGIRYGNCEDLFDGVETVCDWIEAGLENQSAANGASAVSKNSFADASQESGA
jgi:UDP-glucose:(heptosyl)LPS alpha-1,3-glucosyltransferase